jgi:hypothetical protein
MRDGISKSLDLSQDWQRAARFCEQPATRGETARKAVRKAVLRGNKRLIRPEFLSGLRRLTDEPSLFDSSDTLPPPVGPLEQSVLSHLQYLQQAVGGADTSRQALKLGLDDYLQNIVRQCQEQYARDPDPAAMEVARAFANAVAAVDTESIASALLWGKSLSIEPVSPKIDLDRDDLSRPQ